MKKKTIIKTLSTFFGIGLVPFASGTVGSLVGIAIYYFGLRGVVGGRHPSNLLIYLLVLFVLLVTGAWIASAAEVVFGEKDSRYIIIDEVVGYLVAMFGLPPEPFYIILAFILFRAMDILKPPPISLLQDIKGGVGIMLDDVAAGAVTCGILHLIAIIR